MNGGWKQRYADLYGEFNKEKEKDKKILSGDLNPRFDLNLRMMTSKSRQPSKRDRTLNKSKFFGFDFVLYSRLFSFKNKVCTQLLKYKGSNTACVDQTILDLRSFKYYLGRF